MDLEDYNKKRDFKTTPEPQGIEPASSDSGRFVIQRHAARRLHYDLRLEIEGTLKSWAVPKGPSMNPLDKRLAVRTEDHPIKYLSFYGTIPKGNYGAGEMLIWDSGVFEVDTSESNLSDSQQLAEGNLKLIFHGTKIQGRFALVKTGIRAEKEHWLLIKKKDGFAIDLFYDAESLAALPKGKESKYPKPLTPGELIPPMLASDTEAVFNDPQWIYELKWDGYRILAHISERGVFLQSRNGINYNTKFPLLHEELRAIDVETILDGEVVILDENGVSQFGELQNYPSSSGTLHYYVFDMLYLNGHSMLELAVIDRKSLLPEVLEGLTLTTYCDHIEGMGAALFKKATEAGMEGIMAKKSDSTYTPGFRTEHWLKIKSTNSLDALICGYTDSVAGGAAFGSLVLGEKTEEGLHYIGNCGSGFNESYRQELLALFKKYATDSNPFGKKLQLKGRKPNWMLPTLECEVKFAKRTKNGLLRHPVFKRLKYTPQLSQSSAPTTPTINKINTKNTIQVDGLSVPISNLDKVYWPESGYTKFDLIDYYLNVSEVILPHLLKRPQSLHRHPNGISEEGFYQKDNIHVPEWVETIAIYSKSSERHIDYLLCQNAASLLYMANMGCIEINPWNSKIQHLEQPDYGIVDLDPPKGMDFKNVVLVALAFKKVLDMIDLKGYCKLSGSKGLHIYIAMGAQYTYEEVRGFIKLLCYMVEQQLPKITTLERRITNRKGKIYLDYLQNRQGQTIASVYSVRPLPKAPISAPVAWEELKEGLGPQHFKLNTFQKRLNEMGDLFAPILREAIDMEKALKALNAIDL